MKSCFVVLVFVGITTVLLLLTKCNGSASVVEYNYDVQKETTTPVVQQQQQLHHRFHIRSKEERRRSDEWLAQRYHPTHQHDSNLKTNEEEECSCDNSDSNNHHHHPEVVSSSSYDIRNKHKSAATGGGIVLGFAGDNSKGELYNWTHIDMIAWPSSSDLICKAHCHGVRVLLASPTYNLRRDFNVTQWVYRTVRMVQGRSADGIIFDYELPITRAEGRRYVSLIATTQRVLKKHGHGRWMVVTCVPWSPDGIDGRDNYPHGEMATVSDYLYVMDYDTQSQIYAGRCLASANAPYAGMVRGVQRYLWYGISPQKLILGVPWYGYEYVCLNGTPRNSPYCPIEHVPFRGINCSDAAGKEVPYGSILSIYANMTPSEIEQTGGGIRRDEYMNAAFLNHVDVHDNGTVHQFWFDDPTSVRAKFAWARSMGLGGVGPYTLDDLNPIDFPQESEAMWSAFDAFRSLDETTGLYSE